MRTNRACVLGLALAGLLALAGCSRNHYTLAPAPEPAPPPVSPVAAVRLFQWGWNHLDEDPFRREMPADFRFVFAPWDSAGNPFRDFPLDRQAMHDILHHCFESGGSGIARAQSVDLRFATTLVPQPDPRPGMNPRWHQVVATSFDLALQRADTVGSYRVTGGVRFWLVRGDSAAIPPDLAALGVVPDSTRWYVQEWDEETVGTSEAARVGPAGTEPGRKLTWGDLLLLYR